jgi:cell division protein FtsQ
VLVRGVISDAAEPPSRRGKGKRSAAYKPNAAGRRYDVALGVPGAELRLPSLPSLRLGWHFLSALLAIALGGLLYYAWTAPFFRVQAVEVRGLQRLSQADVNTVLSVIGEPVFVVHPLETRQALETAFPEMKAITVEVGLPASVIVTVDERLPVLAWQKEGGEVWVDAEGVSFPPRGEAGPLATIEGDLPSVESLEEAGQALATSPRLEPEFVSAILAVSVQAPKKAHLVYNPEHGLGWEDKRGWQVFFGTTGLDPANMDLKLKIYAALVQRLAKKEHKPVLISVEYVHAPFYRMER